MTVPTRPGQWRDIAVSIAHFHSGESGSIVITTNRPFRDWAKIFDVDNTLATAMIDRLMHHGEALVIEGKSYRNPESNET